MKKIKRRVLYDNINNKLVAGIVIVSVLLIFCVAIDYADDTIVTQNESLEFPNDTIVVNKSVNDGGIVKHDGKLHTDKSVKEKPKPKKKKLATITMTGKPSCSRCARNHIPYKWFTRTYVNYCPNCHHYGTLGNKHKSGSVYEQEISCFHCDSDFCIYDGKEKYSWSRVYLISA